MKRYREISIKINTDKVETDKSETAFYFGNLLAADGQTMDTINFMAIKEMTPPTSKPDSETIL